MKNFSEKIRQWLPAIVWFIVAMAALIRMQTIQQQLIKQVNHKVDSSLYKSDRENLRRELDQIQANQIRLEGKVDNVIIYIRQIDSSNPGN